MLSIDTLRRPEYTGGNRCGPCTAVNAAVIVVAAVVVAAVRHRSLGLEDRFLHVAAAGDPERGRE
ncbi:hypothetical protein GRX01_06445 [Halobaculum sp. WSA2]|uniref:DUF8054 domain-containing protein n=1 Tax=Halobaculum saliterrae TaxID=2073113 RepID=A0A6B0SYD0_9EURY|nr:hypothetical protein [Halobaculum saliterrae]MXR40980.1 hypothetical protein [Halobaculum saliterrae]